MDNMSQITRQSGDLREGDGYARSLTPREKRFVLEYLRDFNPKKAAERCGVPPKSALRQAMAWMADPVVKAEMKRVNGQVSDAVKSDIAATLVSLQRIALSDPRELFNSKGQLKAISDLDDDIAMAIQSVEVAEDVNGFSKTMKVRFWDKVSALDRLGKFQEILVDKVQHEGRVVLAPEPIMKKAALNG